MKIRIAFIIFLAFCGGTILISNSMAQNVKAVDTEADNYIKKLIVKKVEVKQKLGYVYLFGEIKNTGDKTVTNVKMIIYCLDANGKAVYEKDFAPIVEKFNPYALAGLGMNIDSNDPLKPNYSSKFGVNLNSAPSDWAKKVKIKITDVKFK